MFSIFCIVWYCYVLSDIVFIVLYRLYCMVLSGVSALTVFQMVGIETIETVHVWLVFHNAPSPLEYAWDSWGDIYMNISSWYEMLSQSDRRWWLYKFPLIFPYFSFSVAWCLFRDKYERHKSQKNCMISFINLLQSNVRM